MPFVRFSITHFPKNCKTFIVIFNKYAHIMTVVVIIKVKKQGSFQRNSLF